MKRSLLGLAVAAALILGLMQAAQAAPSRKAPTPSYGCGLPHKNPLWIDFGDGSVPFWKIFARPGLVSAAANFRYPPMIRALGGHTVYFDLNFHNRMGSPSNPKPAPDTNSSALKLFYYASASTGCTHPWIALNELFGAGLPTPWSATNTIYRENVLSFVKILSGLGAHVFLLVNSKPYTSDVAGDWWHEVAKYADFVREVYFPAPLLYKSGPVLGSRMLRAGFRKGILDFTDIGIPVSKLGIFLGFQTEKGNGGREGLQPRQAWFRTIKWQVLAARQVARELKFPTIWSWGWGEWGGGSIDPDKPAAACVYLWARNPHLCNGPAAAGPGFDTSLTEGQINLPGGVQCVVGSTRLPTSAILRLAAVTHDRQAAFSTVFARIVAGRSAHITAKQIRIAERAVVAGRFGGSFGAYRAALRRAGAGTALARGVLADELREATLSAHLRVKQPSSDQISSYYQSYGDVRSRPVAVKQRAPWLGGARSGIAIDNVAPAQTFRAPEGRWTTIQTGLGTYRIRPLGPVEPLGAMPFSQARPAIRYALVSIARSNAYQTWIARRQQAALKTTACRGDALPAVGSVDLTTFLPFLAL